MKALRIAVAAAALAAIAAPAAAQDAGYDGMAFVDAVRSRDGDKAIELLNNHPPAFVDSRDGKGDTALLIAVSRSDEQWTGFLLNKGADPNLAGRGGDTPLIAASRVGFELGAEWLIGQGAKVDASNRMGETALIVAVQARQPQLVRLLLAQGADPDRPDHAAGYSARDYALRDNRSREILNLIQAKKPKPAAPTH